MKTTIQACPELWQAYHQIPFFLKRGMVINSMFGYEPEDTVVFKRHPNPDNMYRSTYQEQLVNAERIWKLIQKMEDVWNNT